MKNFAFDRKVFLLLTSLCAFVSLIARGTHAQAPLGPAKSDSAITLQGSGGYLRLDFTEKDSKTQPVLKLGYQSQMSEQIKRARMVDPAGNVHHIPLWSIDVQGTASNGSAALFSGSGAATGADIKFSYGKAYLASYIPSAVSDDLTSNFDLMQVQLNRIETAKARALNDPDIAVRQRKVEQLIADVKKKSAEAKSKGKFEDVARATVIQDYGEEIIQYANEQKGDLDKPTPPDLSQFDRPNRWLLYDALVFRAGYSRGSHTLYTPDLSKAFAGQFATKDFDGWSAQVGYNRNYGGPLPFIIGVAVGGGRYNNADSLTSVKVTDTVRVTDTNSTTTTTSTETGVNMATHTTTDDRTKTRDRTGLTGDYKVSTVGTAKFDIVLYPEIANASKDGKKPRASVALDFFGRAKGGTPFVYGIGAYITQPGAPQKVYGGLNLYRNEQRKLAVDIVAGIPF